MFDIVGIDMPCLDLNVSVDVFPKPNHGSRVRQNTWQGGGKVATGLAAAARLDAQCAIIGAVGDDLYGRFCAKDLERHGVAIESLDITPSAATGFSVVLSDLKTGGRSILYRPGGAKMPTLDDRCRAMIHRAKCLMLASPGGINREAAELARSGGAQVMMDADDTSQTMFDFLPMTDVFIASEYFYNTRYGDGEYEAHLRELVNMGPQVAIFTLGEKGCAGLGPGGYFRLPAFPVDVVDTVGAGDVYHGAFAAALVRGMGAPDAARYASAVAAIKCTRIGGRAGIPNRAVVDRFLRDGYIDYTEIDTRVEFYQRGLDHV
ncbi:MAG: PfkB family carbohydrate kinase [Defluviitaleaceae bacterium]|nr:PfkB family carbohydrate kinase [Defluviitaleaceae bacterium]